MAVYLQFEWYRGCIFHTRLKATTLGRVFFCPENEEGIIMKQMTGLDFKIKEMAGRIRELREIVGLTPAEMAAIPPTSILREFIDGQIL